MMTVGEVLGNAPSGTASHQNEVVCADKQGMDLHCEVSMPSVSENAVEKARETNHACALNEEQLATQNTNWLSAI